MWGAISEQIPDGLFDGAMPKHNGEVLVQGSFFAPGGQAVEAGEVSVQLGTVNKQLRVYPERRWRKVLGAGVAISNQSPITELPIQYDKAFGGEGFKLNPEGIGYQPVDTETGEAHFLPQIEYKNQPITQPGKEYAPASLGRVDQMWQQRLKLAGTYDEKYLNERMPGLPDDIDWQYFNEAAEDQWIDGFFQGDEAFLIQHMHPEYSQLSGQLPSVYGRAFINQDTGSAVEFKEIPTQLDTVWLFPSAEMGVMIYRGTIGAFSNDGSDIKALLLACENRTDTPRELSHYQDQMEKRLDPDNGFKYALYTAPLIAEGMKCGFQQIQEENDFPLDMEAKKNMDMFAAEKMAEAEQQKADAVQQLTEKLKAAGIDPQPYLDKIHSPEKDPLQEKMEALMEKMAPGITSDPENLDLTKLDLAVMDEIQALGDEIKKEKLAEAKANIRTQIDELKVKPEAHLYADAIQKLEDALLEIDLPPVWPRTDLMAQLQGVRQQVATAEQEIDKLRKMGVAEEQLPNIEVDLDDFESKLKEADKRLKDTYRMGAHMMGECRSPHPDQEALLKQQLLQKYRAGESMAGMDFACIDLAGENLKGIDLSECYLEGVDFSGCDLTEANLEGAILACANLEGARLDRTNLKGANLGATNLTDTEFRNINLQDGQLSRARLIRTRFENSCLNDINFLETLFEQPAFIRCEMQKCNFIEPDLNQVSFEGSDLGESNFVKPVMEQADFREAKLNGVNFVEAQLNGSGFQQAVMINSRFVGGCQMNNCDFSGADISQSCLRENQLRQAVFTGATLNEADLSGAQLQHSDFQQATALRAQFIKSELGKADMSRCNLMEGSLFKAMLVEADFSGSNLYCVNFMEATLGGTRFKDANLDQTILKDWRPS